MQRIHIQQSTRTCHCKIQHSHNRKGICVHKSSNYIPDYPSAYAITQSVAQKSRFLQVFPNHLYFKIQLPFLSWNLGTYQPSNWIFVVPWWRSRAVFSHRTFTHGRCCNLIRLAAPHRHFTNGLMGSADTFEWKSLQGASRLLGDSVPRLLTRASFAHTPQGLRATTAGCQAKADEQSDRAADRR